MLEIAPHSPAAGVGWLDGWRLTFGGAEIGWEGALATVVEDPGHQVFVMLYDVTAMDEHLLDRWEGKELDIYTKIRVRVQTLEGEVLAWLYALNDYEGACLPRATSGSSLMPPKRRAPPRTMCASCATGHAHRSDPDRTFFPGSWAAH